MLIARLAVGLSPAASPITQAVDSGQWDAIHVEPTNGNGLVGGIKGHVYDIEIGDPVEGVMVSFQLQSVQTDSEGYYELPEIPVGTQAFTFMKGGYLVAQRDATIVEGDVTTLDVELTPGEGPEPERSLLWLWLLLGIGGTAIIAWRTKRILSEPERPRAGYERISWR